MARYYNPAQGVFTSMDPDPGDDDDILTQNGYTYANNNPVMLVDPDGHYVWAVVNAGFAVYDGYKAYKAGKKAGKKGWATAGSVALAAGSSFVKVGHLKKVSKITKLKSACNCFTEETKLLTEDGEKPIEEIEVGDKVLAKDDETGEMAYKEVEWLFQSDVEETYNITVGDEVITTTDEHPFWIVGKGWVEAQHLTVGDVLTTSDSKELAIDNIEVTKEQRTVYNFKVKDFHTYFVSNLGIWTHNACKTPNKTTIWDIKKGAKAELTYNFHGQKVKAYQDSNGYWWAKDTTGHGGSAYKVFEKKGKELRWKADADKYGNWISDKHKSQTGTVIKLN